MKLGEITCETSLDAGDDVSIINHENVINSLVDIDPISSNIGKNIQQRYNVIQTNVDNKNLVDAIVTFGESTCLEHCNIINTHYNDCFTNLQKFFSSINTLSQARELNELSILKQKVQEKIDNIQTEIDGMDKNAEDYSEKSGKKAHTRQRYETKMSEINARIAKLDLVNTTEGAGAGTTPSSTNTGGRTKPYLVDTGDDDNNEVYGKNENFDINGITSDGARRKWVLGDKVIGLDGKLLLPNQDYNIHGGSGVDDAKWSGVYNKYFTYEKDGKTIYVICNSSGYGTGSDDSLRTFSSPIIYMYKGEDGHMKCFDKSGKAISYNNAMNILEISRCSNMGNQGEYRTTYDTDGNEDSSWYRKATPYSPTLETKRTDTGERVTTEYMTDCPIFDVENTWKNSEAVVINGKSEQWVKTDNKFTDEEWWDFHRGTGCNEYAVFSKDRGDKGTINALVLNSHHNGVDSDERYYSIKQPDGTYLYYDSDCTPVYWNEPLRRVLQ